MSDYIKLAEAPTLSIRMPTCGACTVEVDAGADGLICPCCGTMWSHRDGDDDPGQLYEDWSGEDLDGDTMNKNEAFNAGIAHEEAEREAQKARHKVWRDKQKAKAAFLATAIADPVGQRLATEAVALAVPGWKS